MNANKSIGLSNSLQNLLFPPGRYTVTQLLNLTPYFPAGLKLSLSKHKQLLRQVLDMEEQKLWWVVKGECGQVDAKVLLLVLLLQLMSRQRKVLFNEGVSNIHAPSQSPGLTSPRNRATRALYISNQQTQIMNYIKQNLIIFLRLLCNQLNSQDPLLDAQQLQPLAFLFKVDRNKKFSSYLPYSQKHQNQKHPQSDNIQHQGQTYLIRLVSLQGLNLSVTQRQQLKDKDLRIIGCQQSQIFITSPVRSLYVVNCIHCTIYVAAVERVAFVDKCEKVNFTIAANFLRVCNSHDSLVHYYGPAPLVLTGDNKSLIVGPHNCASPTISKSLSSAGIPVSQALFNSFQQVLYRQLAGDQSVWMKMAPTDFDLLVLPQSEGQQGRPKIQKKTQTMQLLAPKQYILQLQKRNKSYSNLKSKIKESNLSPEMIKQLHYTLQGNFKKWLQIKGQTNNLNNLVKMIDRR